MMLKSSELTSYATMLVNLGVNLQPGQSLVVRATTDAAQLVRKVVKVAYQVGASNVMVDWSDDEVNRIRLHYASEESLSWVPAGRVRDLIQLMEEGAAVISILTPKPDLYKGIDTARIAASVKGLSQAMRKYHELAQAGQVSWTIGIIPTPEWARLVFSDLDEGKALTKLWEIMKEAIHLHEEDPVAYWKEHVRQLEERTAWLNQHRFARLEYRAPGTELTVKLPRAHRWLGGGLKNKQGIFFLPNIPTEEVFTAPLKEGVNGYVRNSKPLVYNGQVIDGFTLTFQHGKVVKAEAEVGESLLKRILAMDEGAAYLGEVALVPDDSLLSKLNVIFQNTLFDENASCHFALGSAYPFCVEEGASLSQEKQGLNASLIHVDFMVGTRKLNIDGVTEDGRVIPLFRDGNWALN